MERAHRSGDRCTKGRRFNLFDTNINIKSMYSVTSLSAQLRISLTAYEKSPSGKFTLLAIANVARKLSPRVAPQLCRTIESDVTSVCGFFVEFFLRTLLQLKR